MKPLLKLRITLLFFYCLFSAEGKAQNLVPNPSFEQFTDCPTDLGQIFKAPFWFQPCKGVVGSGQDGNSTDLYDTCGFWGYSYPSFNFIGYQLAKTGHNYSGIGVAGDTSTYREYLEVGLNTPLTANHIYCVTFYVSLADSSRYAISNMGAYFSHDSLLYYSFNRAITWVTPQVENPSTALLTDTANWVPVSGNFIAAGGERFMTIGNFHGIPGTNMVLTGGGTQPWSYYYIDDVSVIDCTIGVDEFGIGNEDLEIYPNPATSTITIETKNSKIESLKLYNVLGECVKEIPRYAQNDKEIDVSGFSKGIYFIEVETEKGIVRKKVVKE